MMDVLIIHSHARSRGRVAGQVPPPGMLKALWLRSLFSWDSHLLKARRKNPKFRHERRSRLWFARMCGVSATVGLWSTADPFTRMQ